MAMRTRCEIKIGSVRIGISQPQHEFHIVQRFFTLAVLQFGNRAQLQHLGASFQVSQMREQNGQGVFRVVIEWKPRIRQLARLPQFFESPNRICSTPAKRLRRAIAAASRREIHLSLLSVCDNNFARLSDRSGSAFCQLPMPLVGQYGQLSSPHAHFQPVNEICVAPFIRNFLSVAGQQIEP